MTLTENLKKFLIDTTTGKADEGMGDLLSTSQNSTEILSKWKHMKQLVIRDIKLVESQCKDVYAKIIMARLAREFPSSCIHASRSKGKMGTSLPREVSQIFSLHCASQMF